MAIARTPRITGAFQGAMPSTTPTGWRNASARLLGLSVGITSPAICVVMAAASRSMPAASITLNPAQPAVAPISAIISCANSSARPARMVAAFSSRARRSVGPSADQAGKAAAAESAARTASSTVAAATVLATSPEIGLCRAYTAFPVAGRSLPPMKRLIAFMGISFPVPGASFPRVTSTGTSGVGAPAGNAGAAAGEWFKPCAIRAQPRTCGTAAMAPPR